MNKFTKWLSNFWYHYKLRTILCLFLAVVVGVSVFEFATRETYDVSVCLYTSKFISSETIDALEKTVEDVYKKQGEDKNVQVINLSYDPYSTSGEQRMSYASALAAEFRLKEHYLFITDEYRFKELDEMEVFKNAFEKNENFDKFGNKAFSLKDSNFEKNFSKHLIENGESGKLPELYISVLTPPEKTNKNYENYKTAKSLAELIKKEG